MQRYNGASCKGGLGRLFRHFTLNDSQKLSYSLKVSILEELNWSIIILALFYAFVVQLCINNSEK